MKIAVYGKGGIGKSTISANISAALSQDRSRVLQIGCDPKHDSTRLLLGGNVPVTVLEYVKEVLPDERCLEDIVFCGYGSVACVEAGGPEPGVGCAGRGIITTFELLNSLGLAEKDFDYVIYDVLGDVVCGGFAVPIRTKYADAVYLVTSGEFMALYAANNILRGVRNYGNVPGRVAGIIQNSRGIAGEDVRVARFAKAVHLPVLAQIPRSHLFAEAERLGKTVVEAFPDSSEAAVFQELALQIQAVAAGEKSGFSACPLDDAELESMVLGMKGGTAAESFQFAGCGTGNRKPRALSENVRTKYPLHGCAFAGAVCVTMQVEDAYTLVHCPKSCAHMIYDILENAYLRMYRLYGDTADADLSKRFGTTNLEEADFIFGGIPKLKASLRDAAAKGYTHIFVVTSCPSGIIGDDAGRAAAEMMAELPGVVIDVVPVDGNLSGDFSQGYICAFEVLAGYVEPGSCRRENSINIIGEKALATNVGYDFAAIHALLAAMGISVNCRYAARTSIAEIKRLNSACLNLPAHDDFVSRELTDLVARYSDLPMLDMAFPSGFTATAMWLGKIGAYFGKEREAEELTAKNRVRYEEALASLRWCTAGRTMLISTYSRNIDWMLELAGDLGMEVVRVGLMQSPANEPLRTRYTGLPVETAYSVERRREDIRGFQPDLVLADRPALGPDEPARCDAIPYSPGFGFLAGVRHAERWCRLMKLPAVAGWRYDGDDIL